MKTVLLVDDDTALRDQLAKALHRRGYDCHPAADGKAALDHIRACQVDAAVVDFRMPGLAGIDLISELHDLSPHTRIIVLTGYGSIATALESVRRGAADYLTKPVNADQVAASIEGRSVEADANMQAPSLDMVEWDHIQRVLADCGGNISKAALVLGLHRRSLQRKLDRYAPWR